MQFPPCYENFGFWKIYKKTVLFLQRKQSYLQYEIGIWLCLQDAVCYYEPHILCIEEIYRIGILCGIVDDIGTARAFCMLVLSPAANKIIFTR